MKKLLRFERLFDVFIEVLIFNLQLKETFEVVSDDLIKVHEKVDRVKDVNLSNVENLQQLVDK